MADAVGHSNYQEESAEFYSSLYDLYCKGMHVPSRRNVEEEPRYEDTDSPGIRNLNDLIALLVMAVKQSFPGCTDVTGADYGCGAHYFVHLIRTSHGWDADGYDCEKRAIEEAHSLYPASASHYHLRNLLTDRLPAGEATLHFVFCNAVIQHFSDAELRFMLSDTVRTLRPGGILLLIFKRDVDDWQAVARRMGTAVHVQDVGDERSISIEDKPVAKAVAAASARRASTIPTRLCRGARRFRVWPVGALTKLALAEGLGVHEGVRDGRDAVPGVVTYFSGRGIPTCAAFLRKGGQGYGRRDQEG